MQGDLLLDINTLVATSSNSLIVLPINFENWHFILLVIDTLHRKLYFFDSLNAARGEWVRLNVRAKTNSISTYLYTSFTDSFQVNNDCGFLVLNFVDQIYQRNSCDINIENIYQSIKQEYDSGFLRQYYCNYVGTPYVLG